MAVHESGYDKIFIKLEITRCIPVYTTNEVDTFSVFLMKT